MPIFIFDTLHPIGAILLLYFCILPFESIHLNSIGLALNIVGIMLILYNGLPPTDANPTGSLPLLLEGKNPILIKK